MNTQIRRAALRAAGKVAFGATLSWGSVTACGGKVEYPADESATVQSATPAAESEAPSSGKEPDAASSLGEASRTSSLACVGQLDQNTASSVTAVELDCCVAFAKYHVLESEARDAGATVAEDPSYKNCCLAVVYSAMPMDWAVHIDCCNALDAWSSVSACTPWGPPVPPSMDLEIV